MTSLEYLLLNDNNLTGPISPELLNNLSGLVYWDFSNNNLSEPIPPPPR